MQAPGPATRQASTVNSSRHLTKQEFSCSDAYSEHILIMSYVYVCSVSCLLCCMEANSNSDMTNRTITANFDLLYRRLYNFWIPDVNSDYA